MNAPYIRIEEYERSRAEPPRPLFRQAPPAEAYPLHALGPTLQPVAEAVIDVTQAAPAICANAVLGAASLAAQAHADVRLPSGQSRPLTLFLLTIAASGERKTSADREALAGVRLRERELRDAYKLEAAAVINAREAYEAARAAAVKAGKGDIAITRNALDAIGLEPKSPTRPILVMTEPTVEGLVKMLADAPPSVGLFSSEGGSFLGGHALSDESKLRSAARLSSLWDGEPIDRVRSAGEAHVIVGKRVAVHLMAQPDAAMKFLADGTLRDQGLFSRLLISAPEMTAGTRLFREPSESSRATVNLFATFVRELMTNVRRPGVEGDLPIIGLDEEAKALFVSWHDHVERELGAGGKLAPIRGFAAKLAEHAARIASVLTIVENPNATNVGADAMSAGTMLADYYAGEALRLAQWASTSENLRTAEKLLRWCQERGRPLIHLAEVYQFGPAELREKATAAASMRVLEDHGWMQKMKDGAEIDGVHRRDVWQPKLGEN